jgi:aryl-alcohol dehydrogenase (NADP+)
VSPLCLGGNVFGWTADEDESFGVLDAYADAGGNFIDTADQYSAWAPGRSGGESETIIGRWLMKRRNRDDIVLATKVGQAPGLEGLSAPVIRAAIDASLTRLRTDRVDLYYAHFDDRETPLEETLGAFTELVGEGKVRYVAASKYTAPRLSAALAVSDRDGLVRYVALQPHYNLVERREYEGGGLAELCAQEGLACLPYRALAHGFLSGKYRDRAQRVDSVREDDAKTYLTRRGRTVLSTLDEIARRRATTVAAVALAWLAEQPTVVAPIASARRKEQLEELLPMTHLILDADEEARLDHASA